MRHAPRFLTRSPGLRTGRLRHFPRTRAPGALAPESLRRRVLASVRGEAHGPRDSASTRVAGITLVLIACLLAAGLYLGTASPTPSGSDRAVRGAHGLQASLRQFGARAELLVSGMSEPPIGEVYEVWLDRAGRPPQATDALFTVTSNGKASVDVPGSLHGVREIAVTSEPLGGSTHPTSPAVLRVVLVPRG
jgi:hypothetical protein